MIFFRKKASVSTLVITIVAIVLIIYFNTHLLVRTCSFFGGIIGSFLVRSNKFCFFARKMICTAIAVMSLITAVIAFPTGYNYISLALISITFILIACGNTIFGILTTSTSRTLGKMAYSIYLLHGIILYITF